MLSNLNHSLSRLESLAKKWETLSDDFQLKHKSVNNDINFYRVKITSDIRLYKDMINNKNLRETVEKDIIDFINC